MTPKAMVLALLMLVLGCQTAYYAAWEKMGKEKRHLLRDNVEKAQQEQQAASKAYESVLDRIREVYGFKGGDLETFYKQLKGDYRRCEQRAEEVNHRIGQVQEIAGDLFSEWQKEIDQISNATFQQRSRRSLTETKARYLRLENAMIRAQERMAPVLVKLNDYVIFLKHNLNARAIGALRQEVGGIEGEVASLIGDIARSIQEADAFLKELETQGGGI